ncbi:MAG: CfrBI family restriction endonuclease [Proteobacteria bacterium]|nr:CfrBI family restriction endonuclease [Pseudomonadota bacterium]MCL2307069.1 CfrBI family restriction endonuclease [Pseudomonadota bacterium]
MNGIQLLEAFPASAIDLLAGSGREFIQRIGEDAARQAVLGVLQGDNVRSQTEFLTRARISQLSAAIVAQYLTACSTNPNFARNFFEIAMDAVSKQNKQHPAWLSAQWFLGLTGKSVQNVLRGDTKNLVGYVTRLAEVLSDSAQQTDKMLGAHTFTLEGGGNLIRMDWEQLLRVTTAIGAQTLSIRGSDKSMYGKLFERLVLGSVLDMLGFHLVTDTAIRSVNDIGAFWLSDNQSERETDATAVIGSGKIALFDIGFIGAGNSEITKDKLSRFSAENNMGGTRAQSRTFIIIDRLPNTRKTHNAAQRLQTELVQMSMKFWPLELAQKLKAVGWNSELAEIDEANAAVWLEQHIANIDIFALIGNTRIDAEIQE